MVGILNIVVIACLLRGALCGVFEAIMPQTIEVVSGSCVTIPCSFDVTVQFVSNLDNTCKARWKKDGVTVFDSSKPQTTINDGKLTGDLSKKDCTTTLNNIQPVDNNKKYSFRLDCSGLGYDFSEKISFSVRADPLRPTLTPSTLEVKEGTSVSLTCSAPAPCLSHPPNLTWTPGLGDSQETLQENQDKTKVQTSVVSFTASLHLHHGKTISCTATYNKQDGSAESAVSTSLTANISFAPEILPSSNCTKAGAQLNCSCETVGNPSPTLIWYLDGSPVNNSDNLTITYEPPNDTGLRSIITVNQPQERDLSTLLCRTSNSLGSASHHFCAYCLQTEQGCRECQECSGGVTFLAFIITVGVLSAALFCALLFAIRARGTGCHTPKKSQSTGDTSPAVMSQGLTTENGNKVSCTSEEDIYVNTDMMKKSDMPNAHLAHQQVASKSSDKTNEANSDVVYSSVIWKSKEKKGECSGGRGPSGSSCLEEERCMEGGMLTNYVSNAVEMGSLYDNTRKDVKEAVYSEYAQVHFRDTNVM
uniref:sialic acid-binding Ig-like lectin 14 n=1 Tax=Epinephelus lanceolatus TaxID=310571 RepID=UPI0014452D12|nr:sialic acid-binding Ig-like lectin 14 [Epinephelus lanceolatus]